MRSSSGTYASGGWPLYAFTGAVIGRAGSIVVLNRTELCNGDARHTPAKRAAR